MKNQRSLKISAHFSIQILEVSKRRSHGIHESIEVISNNKKQESAHGHPQTFEWLNEAEQPVDQPRTADLPP